MTCIIELFYTLLWIEKRLIKCAASLLNHWICFKKMNNNSDNWAASRKQPSLCQAVDRLSFLFHLHHLSSFFGFVSCNIWFSLFTIYSLALLLHSVRGLSSPTSTTPSICVFPPTPAPHFHSDPQSSERTEADRSDQGMQFHLPLSFRPKPPRIALQAVKDRWMNT